MKYKDDAEVLKSGEYILSLDVSTKTIGVAMFKDNGTEGELVLVTHVTPKAKPKPESKIEELIVKVRAFEEEFLNKYASVNITKVIIEEPLLRANNVRTVGTLLKFNGLISRSVYEVFGVVPEYISSYDSRKYAFPQLMAKRTKNKKGEEIEESKVAKAKPVLFGAYPTDVDKKQVVLDLVTELHPQIKWPYNRNMKIAKEAYDQADAVCCAYGFMQMIEKWEVKK